MTDRFDDFQKHCTACRKGQPCGDYHVYVMELDPGIAEIRWFQDVNPNYRSAMLCVYVGQTKHLPRCRQSSHMNCPPSNWRGRRWSCYCEEDGPAERACKVSTRGSKKVGKYSRYALKPKLFKRLNPQPDQESSKAAERTLAESLRAQGYGVWAGHHDGKSG